MTELMTAAYAGDLEKVEQLLAAGADVNATDEAGWSALMKACYNAEQKRGFADVVQALIDAGANIEAPIGYGVRPRVRGARW
jgi:ankyrin repeat protein